MGIEIESSKPLYTIGVAADILGISPRMLREYEKMGFIKPARVGAKRLYSNNDLYFIKNIKFYLEEIGMTTVGLKVLYMMAPCWEIKQCGNDRCPAYHNCDSKCWKLVANAENCDALSCSHCPLYLVHLENMGVKIVPEKEFMPTCFTG